MLLSLLVVEGLLPFFLSLWSTPVRCKIILLLTSITYFSQEHLLFDRLLESMLPGARDHLLGWILSPSFYCSLFSYWESIGLLLPYQSPTMSPLTPVAEFDLPIILAVISSFFILSSLDP